MVAFVRFASEDFVCLVLEYLRGGELFDYLSEHGPFNEDQARHAMRRILLALQTMHVKGIVHRDLKVGRERHGRDTDGEGCRERQRGREGSKERHRGTKREIEEEMEMNSVAPRADRHRGFL